MKNQNENEEEKQQKNIIILLANQKGGCGKSLICAHLAMLLLEKNYPVAVVDADIQQTLVRHRQRELAETPDAEIPYPLQPLDTSKPEQVKAIMQQLKTLPAIVLIDCPGNIYDPALRYIFEAADIAVVPFRYDADNIDATDLFAGVFTKISKAKMFFIPNSVNKLEERRDEVAAARESAYGILHKYGYLCKKINQGVAVKCYSTLEPLNRYQEAAVKFAFEDILKDIGLF